MRCSILGVPGILYRDSRFLIALLTACILTACAKVEKSTATTQSDLQRTSLELQSATLGRAAVHGFNDFSLRVMKEFISEREPGENMVVSPLGLAVCTSMLTVGSKGQTQKELLHALSPDDKLAIGDCSLIFKSFCRPLQYIEVSSADSIYSLDGVKLNEPFEASFARYFDGTVHYASSPKELSLKVIDWARAKTNNKIVLAPDNIPPNSVGILNALYFNAKWMSPFEKQLTKSEKFVRTDKSTVIVPMMHRYASYAKYGEFEGSQMIMLPYRNAPNNPEAPYAMYVILPEIGESPEHLLSGLTEQKLSDLIDSMRSGSGWLAFPRFGISSNASFRKVFQKLGVRRVFDASAADLTEMVYSKQVCVDDIKQILNLAVDERGTEVAVVTSANVALGAPPSTFEMVVNRPFLFVLRDEANGAIHLIGIVNDPVRESALKKNAVKSGGSRDGDK